MWDKIAKLVVKQAFKLATPVVGSVLVEAGGELAGIFIDKRSKDALEAIKERLVQRLIAELRAANIDNPDEEYLAPLEASIVDILGDENTIIRAWTDCGFDAGRAAEQVLKSNAAFQVGLSDAEKSLCKSVFKWIFSCA